MTSARCPHPSRSGRIPGLACLLAALAAAGCHTPHYEWGDSEGSVRRILERAEGFDLRAEIAQLERQLAETEAAQGIAPPGLRAHLGLLQAEAGEVDAARASFEGEKDCFPESGPLMDVLIGRLGS